MKEIDVTSPQLWAVEATLYTLFCRGEIVGYFTTVQREGVERFLSGETDQLPTTLNPRQIRSIKQYYPQHFQSKS